MRRGLRGGEAWGALALSLCLCGGVFAQENEPPAEAPGDVPAEASVPGLSAVPLATGAEASLRAPVVTLDRERLFVESRWGQAVQAQYDRESAALVAENRRLEAALEEEERQLTTRRAAMTPESFRPLAAEFDQRVEALRQAQDAKSRAITRLRDERRLAFFEAAVPVLGQLMLEIEALAIIDRSAIILTFDQLDITEMAIARLDAELAAGRLPALPGEAVAPPDPAPGADPETAPETAPGTAEPEPRPLAAPEGSQP